MKLPRLRRPCERCNKMFVPNSKSGRLCDDCRYQFRGRKALFNKNSQIDVRRTSNGNEKNKKEKD